MLKKVADLKDEQNLYEYFKKISPEIPNYFPVDFDTWRESMFNECDNSFYELETYLLYEGNVLKGFIQYGLTNYIFGETESDYPKHYALIRNMHYAKGSKNPEELMETALNYFKKNEMKFIYPTEKPACHLNEITAYFFPFGMRCYARGALHESQFYMEELLDKYLFTNKQTSFYFSKDLHNSDVCNDFEITCKIEPAPNRINVKFILGDEVIGSCSLEAVQETIYWMWWFGINEQYQKRGLGTRCLNNIFCILKEKNAQKLDTNTYTDNFAAQALYTKTGFVNKGLIKIKIKKYLD